MVCIASLTDVYSRRRYQPCFKAATKRVTLDGVAVGGAGKWVGFTPMCDACAHRTAQKWEGVVIGSTEPA